jgi:hypothetical protein
LPRSISVTRAASASSSCCDISMTANRNRPRIRGVATHLHERPVARQAIGGVTTSRATARLARRITRSLKRHGAAGVVVNRSRTTHKR